MTHKWDSAFMGQLCEGWSIPLPYKSVLWSSQAFEYMYIKKKKKSPDVYNEVVVKGQER